MHDAAFAEQRGGGVDLSALSGAEPSRRDAALAGARAAPDARAEPAEQRHPLEFIETIEPVPARAVERRPDDLRPDQAVLAGERRLRDPRRRRDLASRDRARPDAQAVAL